MPTNNGLTIVTTGPIDPVAATILSPFGELLIAANGNESTLMPLMESAVALIVRGGGVATGAMIRHAPHLRVIGRSGVGYDSVDVGAMNERRIPLVYVPGAGAQAVAEAALAFILASAKNLFYWDREMKAGNWASRFRSNPRDIAGSTVGVLGIGNIGSRVARLARAFDARVLAYDPAVSEEQASASGAELATLEQVLSASDFITLHAPLTPETRGIVNRRTLSLVKNGAVLVNLARGGLVESLDVLYECLQNRKLAGVGLDVFEPEPPDTTHPIFQLPNVLTSPHALGMTEGAMQHIFRSMAEDMAAVLDDRRPQHVVNPEVFIGTPWDSTGNTERKAI